MLDAEAQPPQPIKDIVALGLEVALQRLHLRAYLVRFEHGDGGFLEGNVGAAVEVGAAAADGTDEFAGADDPCYALGGC